jgi:polyisoprenoid-binding protein YceI
MNAVATQSIVGTWNIDPTHSAVEFTAKHMMITKVRGRFGKVEGSVTLPSEDIQTASVDVKIDAASIDTRTGQRDDHLKSGDFLDVANYPQITFRSRRVEGSLEGSDLKVIGDLEIRGTSREVELDVEFEGHGLDPWGGERISFSADTKIDRREFGLTWNQALETGGVLVGNDIRIHLDIQLVKQA